MASASALRHKHAMSSIAHLMRLLMRSAVGGAALVFVPCTCLYKIVESVDQTNITTTQYKLH